MKAIVEQVPGQGVFGGGEVRLFSQYFPSKTRRKEITDEIKSKNLSRWPRRLAYHDKKGQVDDRVSRPRTLPQQSPTGLGLPKAVLQYPSK
jgi:hypothetical protein